MKTSRSRRLRKSLENPLRRNLIHSGGVALLITLLVASGAGVSYAYWNSQATGTSTVQGGQIAVITNFAGLNAFAFDEGVFTSNGSFTATNATQGTTRTMPVSSQLSATVTPAARTANLTVAVWQNTTACTVKPTPSGATTGQLGAIPPVLLNLGPGASATFCVRVVDSTHSQLGGEDGFTITPTVTSTISPNAASGWLASATHTGVATTVPAGTGAILSCGLTTDGRGVILSWPHTATNLYDAYLVDGTTVTPIRSPLLKENTPTQMSIYADLAWPSGNANLKIRVSDAQHPGAYKEFPVKKTGGSSGNVTLECAS
ncbi:hypothetical protein [Homoserinimonas sp. A520]